jgi:RES domain-containing protein
VSNAERLARAVQRCAELAISWSGELYRSSSPRYANKDDLLSGAGSKTAGGRWNPPKSFRTVYTSLDPHTAIDEALAHFVHFDLPIAKAMPRVLVALDAQLQQVLNLTDDLIRQALRVPLSRLVTESWRDEQGAGREALTQVLGRIAFETNWEGLLVPSAARKSGRNLIIFPAKLRAGSRLLIVNKSELPRRF